MSTLARVGLNDPGEDAIACIVRGGALHVSRGARTSPHSHYAWKVHVGLDAPVWYQAGERTIDGASVLLIPPSVEHSTGAVGWSCAFFLRPGTGGAPWRAASPSSAVGRDSTVALGGAQAQRLVALARELRERPRESAADGIAAVSALCAAELSGPRLIDARVEGALERLRLSPDVTLSALARAAGLSVDRLSRLVSQGTGMRLRPLALWSRLLHLLSQGSRLQGSPQPSIASAAYAAGFADHAHLTRTYRRMLGRAPSEFRAPPEVLQHW
jgi:AraC-like DNA-binding protein